MSGYREIKVDLDVWKEIVGRMTSFDEKPNEVLRRVFKLERASSSSPSPYGAEILRIGSSPLSFKDAAIEILKTSGSSIHYKEITKLAVEKKLLTSTGLTPDQTMSATLSTNSKGMDSIFIAHRKGYYSLRDHSEGVRQERFSGSLGFLLNGKEHWATSAKEVLINAFEEITKLTPDFPEKFVALPKHGRNRRYMAKNREELYEKSPHLIEKHSYQLSNGYWIGTNYSQAQIRQILQKACQVADLTWGEEFIVQLEASG